MSQPNKCLLLCRHAFPLVLFCLALVRPGSRAMGGLATQGKGKEDQSCLSEILEWGSFIGILNSHLAKTIDVHHLQSWLPEF